jgi:hydrogenase nickel incorporation protein HypA/HybF
MAMHELSVCQSMMQQVEAIAAQENARQITSITLRIGPLSGIEPDLLLQAFPVAAAGSVAEQAELKIENQAVRIHCSRCSAENEVPSNRLTCPECGELHTRIVTGDELLLASVELLRD